MMRSLIQATSAYELSADITDTVYGHNVKLITLVPTARHPEDHVKFQGLFTTIELTILRDSISQALEAGSLIAECTGRNSRGCPYAADHAQAAVHDRHAEAH